MWVFTQTGFVSAVRHRDNKDQLMIRARDHESLVDLADLASAEIVKTPGGDYPYRVTVQEETFHHFMSMSIEALDYTNFKNRVDITRGHHYHDVLSGVWSIMHDVEDEDARKRYAAK